MDLIKLSNQIYKYYKDNRWDDLIEVLFNNKSLINNEYKNYISSIKLENKPVDILVNFSDTLLNEYKNYKDNKIPFIRLIVLKLIEIKHKLKLKESTEIKIPTTKITYITTIADDEIKTKLFALYLIIYYFECQIRELIFDSLLNKRPHVGIDYEFNQRKIALMQINFETVADENLETNSYIWLVNPGEFNDEINDMLINLLMTNQKIYKILHGPDSLDIPYMYDVMFKGDFDTIIKFTKKVLDTRFLCEYFRLSVSEEKKCSIYYALKYFDTITNDKMNELENIHDSMGPVQDIDWNIHKMSSFHIKYALYDVLFLKHYLLDIYRKIKKYTPQYSNSYKYVNSIIRFTFLERNDITKIIDYVKEIVNPMNNYLIKYRGKKITLVNIYNQVIENLSIPEEAIDVNFLLTVGYIKKTLIFLFKFIVFYIVNKNYTVFINKNEILKDKIDINIIYNKLKDSSFSRIIYLLNLIQNEVQKKILTLYI